MTSLKLRDYQREAIDATFRAWADGMKRPAIVLPTGAGKTVVFSALIGQWCNGSEAIGTAGLQKIRTGRRVIVLVHRDELADQAIAKIRHANPDLRVGKVKAEDNDVYADVVVCSVQTISRSRRLKMLVNGVSGSFRPAPVGLIITDECHHAAAPSYAAVYREFPGALHLGVTATMARGDGIGLGDVWEDVVYSRSILNLISLGHLVDVRAASVEVEGLRLGSVKTSRGDYRAGDLGAAMEESGAQHAISRAYKDHASDRQGIVFTPTVATAEQTAGALTDSGIPAAVLSGATPREERLSIFEGFRSGRTQALVNCMVLTEGFDAPWASCAVIARPTQSQPLYVQMVGRVLRPWPDGGKKDALVLNMNGAGGKLSTLVDLEPGTVTSLADGESLTEAVEREEREGHSRIQAGHPAFGLTYKEVDLFAASHSAWLATREGVRFLSAGEFTFFLWPSRREPGSWDVCWMDKTGRASTTNHTGLDLEMAMTWGEAEAENYGSFSVSRKASWRRGKPSEKQVSLGVALGIDPTTLSKAELSDAISVVLASRRLDPQLARLGD
jgi:superfamily II DNA or RNA helicase